MANRRYPSSRATDGHDDDIRDVNEPVDQMKRAAALSDLLDVEWDPLGHYDPAVAQHFESGAYRAYVPAILKLLDKRAPATEIAWHLRDIAHREMDLPPSGREADVAGLLLRWHALWST